MRKYYEITKVGTITIYREDLHKELSLMYPNNIVTQQNLADQRRVIIKNKYLSEDTQ